jgi:hypothetical protein
VLLLRERDQQRAASEKEVRPEAGANCSLLWLYSYTGIHGPTGIFWANLTPCSPQTKKVDPGNKDQCTTKCFGDQADTCGGNFRVEIIDLGCPIPLGWYLVVTFATVASLYAGGGTVYTG